VRGKMVMQVRGPGTGSADDEESRQSAGFFGLYRENLLTVPEQCRLACWRIADNRRKLTGRSLVERGEVVARRMLGGRGAVGEAE